MGGGLSYANVMSTIGVLLALGGTSYAAIKLPSNSVGSAQIKASAVRTSELASNAVTSTDVKDRSLLARDFALGQLPTGATGANGATGLTGPQGPAGVVGAVTVQREDFTASENATTGVQVSCPAGMKAIGGGAALDDTIADGVNLTVSRPFRSTPGADGDKPVDSETFDAWRVAYRNEPGGTGSAPATAWVVCAQT